MKKLIELEMRKKQLQIMMEKFEDEIEEINLQIDKINDGELVAV